MTVLALTCFHGNDDALQAKKQAVGFLRTKRNHDGSYGNSVYSTCLVMQVTAL
jgi:hypothetical protein